jgi:tetraacyldisaccharide 4'-kinase
MMAGSFRTALTRYAHRMWQTRGLVSTLLLPLSWAVQGVVARKRRQYQQTSRNTPPVPVIVVGNIMVGGTGKTPVVIELAQRLQALGHKPGVISRGYGSQAGETPRTGIGQVDPALFGDEPALIARDAGVPVAVFPKRLAALHALLQTYPETDIVISDDGLQHLALPRNLEIVVQDDRGIGNGRVLPAGPLREPATRLNTVDLIITNTATGTNPAPQGTAKQMNMWLEPVQCTQVATGKTLPWSEFMTLAKDQTFAAVAAIGQPTRFFNMLNNQGLTLTKTVALPDHDDYRSPPFSDIDADCILITQKDAVKCTRLNDARLWSVRVAPRFSDEQWVGRLLDRLQLPNP